MKPIKQVLLATAVALALGSIAVEAAPVSAFLKGGPNNASDQNREYLIDNIFTTPGSIDVGDSLRGVINMNTLNDVGANLGGATPNNEWTAVFQAIVTSRFDVPIFGGTAWTFGPDPAFVASICGGVAGCVSAFVPGPGAMAVMFEGVAHNAAQDFTDATSPVARGPVHDDGALGPYPVGGPPPSTDVGTASTVTEEAFVATHIDGLHFWTLGFSGPGGLAGPGEGWSASTPIGGAFGSILAAFAVSSGTAGVLVNAGLSCLVSGVGDCSTILPITAGAFGPVQFALTSTVGGVKDLDTAFEASSNTNVAFNRIPEPGTLGLLGIAFAGLGFASSRRGKKSA